MADNPSDRAVATPDEQAGEVTGGAAAVGSGQVGGSVKADEGGAPQAPAGQGGGGSARGRAGMRDMLLSMVVLAVAVLVLAAVSRGCSFSPGGASDDSTSLPPVDVTAELQAAVGQVHFPLRQPTLPTGWHANSDSVASVGPQGADQTVQVGWIAPGGQFLQLSQSNGTVLDLVRKAAGLADGTPVSQTGTQTVDGTKWTVYPGVRTEQSWAADLGPVRLLITGNGSTDQFRTLATATRSGAIVR